MPTDREQFEAWIVENRPDAELYRRDVKGSTRFGEYCKSAVQEQWEVFQASRRAALEECAVSFGRFFARSDMLDVGYVIDSIRALADGDNHG